MKNLQKYLMILGTIMLSMGISACSKQPDFDAKSYVQSSLDAYYHGEYKDYANLLELSEKDAKKEIEEDFNESIQQQFDDSDNITDKGIADYTEKTVIVKVSVEKDNSGKYGLSDTEMNKLEATMFPTE